MNVTEFNSETVMELGRNARYGPAACICGKEKSYGEYRKTKSLFSCWNNTNSLFVVNSKKSDTLIDLLFLNLLVMVMV